jgi:hypothetical protein
MRDAGLTRDERKRSNRLMRTMILVALAGFGSATGGCVNVTAPDKPIQINLNISVTQEVVYRLDNDAKTAIQQNPGIF